MKSPSAALLRDAPDALDVLILGGGPAGSAAAIELALAGRRVALLERSLTAHDKVCGDFLSAEALTSLAALGLNPAALAAVPINHVRLAGALGISSAQLPFAAQSLTRRALDDALLDRASAAGALVLRGHSAESLHRTNNSWHVGVSTPSRTYALTAPHIILATGKHDLRGLPRPTGPHPDLVGLKMYLRLTPTQTAALRDTIELVLLPRGYGGLSLVEKSLHDPGKHPQNSVISTEGAQRRSGETRISTTPATEDGVANLCFVLHRDLLRETGRGWPAIYALLTRNPHLRTRLEGAQPLLDRPLAISPIPYGHLLRHAIAANLFAVGDQAAVIPSFTGDGLALALHSGRLAAHTLLAGRSSHHFHAQLYAQLRRQISLATFLSRALVAQPQRSVLELAVRIFPGVLSTVASHTRIAAAHHIPARDLAPRENTCTAA